MLEIMKPRACFLNALITNQHVLRLPRLPVKKTKR